MTACLIQMIFKNMVRHKLTIINNKLNKVTLVNNKINKWIKFKLKRKMAAKF